MENIKTITLGYIRVSTDKQNLDRQLTAIKEYRPNIEYVNIFSDKHTGKEFNRDGYLALKAIIAHYRSIFSKDELIIELVIKELDRLGRDYNGIMEELKWLKDNDVIVRILEIPLTLQEVSKENSWILEMTLNIIIEVYARIAQQEIEKKHQRQMEGLAEARKKGKRIGRPEIQVDNVKFKLIAGKAINGEMSHAEAMRQLELKNNTYWKNLKQMFPGYNTSN